MSVRIIAFTTKGCSLAVRIRDHLASAGLECIAERKGAKTSSEQLNEVEEGLKEWVGERFSDREDMVFIGATGIAVRCIAPYVKGKTEDPAVLVIDEKGRFIIPLLSGHIGGANDLAFKISDLIGGTVVVTTATDINEVFAVDVFAKDNDLVIEDMALAKDVSAAILSGEKVGFSSDIPFSGELPKGLIPSESGPLGIWVARPGKVSQYDRTLFLRPRPFCVGIGCRRGTPMDMIEKAVLEVLRRNRMSIDEVHLMASIDLKVNEEGLILFSESKGIPFVTYSKDELESVADPDMVESDFVMEVTGVGNVSQRAAALAADGPVIQPKVAIDGVTVSIAARRQVLRFRDFRNDYHD